MWWRWKFWADELMNEWMMHLYSAFCVLLYTQSALQSCGGGVSPQPPPVCSIHLDDATAPVRSPHTSYRWRGEREIEPIKWMGIIRRPWLTRASGGNLARTPGLHPTPWWDCFSQTVDMFYPLLILGLFRWNLWRQGVNQYRRFIPH